MLQKKQFGTGRTRNARRAKATQTAASFDEVERKLSLTLDALLNAIETYRETKKRGGA